MKTCVQWHQLKRSLANTSMHCLGGTSYTVPCFQGDVTVEQPVVVRAAGVLTTGRTLRRSRAVCGRGTWVTPRRVVAPVQGVNGGRMVLMIGRVGVGER